MSVRREDSDVAGTVADWEKAWAGDPRHGLDESLVEALSAAREALLASHVALRAVRPARPTPTQRQRLSEADDAYARAIGRSESALSRARAAGLKPTGTP